MSIKNRSNEEEIMDDLSISGQVVDQTLKELNVINQYLGGNNISIQAFKKKAFTQACIADLGCGGGDIMVAMAVYSRKKNLNCKFIGIDANPNIISYAENNTATYQEISYQSINIFSEDFKTMNFDVIHCCLFLHHFSKEQLVGLFKQFKVQAKKGVIINDLHRHPLAYYSISWLTNWFSKSTMVKNDAKLSVARGFKRGELKELLESAGITNYSLKWKWAFRWLLTF